MKAARDTQIRRMGYGVFFLSGVCAMSSGVVVSLLREQHGLSFAQTGTLLSMMSIGNMLTNLVPCLGIMILGGILRKEAL